MANKNCLKETPDPKECDLRWDLFTELQVA